MDDYDVVIIGAGAGGGACAWSLVKAGARVCILDAGPQYQQTDYRLQQDDWERTMFPEKTQTRQRQSYAPMQLLAEQHQALRSWNHLNGNLNQTTHRLPYGYHHVVGVGGSTLHYTGEAHRLNPEAMQMQSRFGVAADWPISYQQLEPYYQQAEKIIGVAGKANARCPRSEDYPLPAHAINYNSQVLARGFAACDMHLEPNSLAILSRPYDGRPACNHCNNCTRGCPRADKGSVDVTFIRQVQTADNLRLKPESRVTRLLSSKSGNLSAVEYSDHQGNLHKIKARVVVVACGAVETPRLLLHSQTTGGESLANQTGQLGKHFMETVFWHASALYPEPLGSHRGIPSDTVCWDYNDPDAIEGVIGGCRFSSGVAEADLVGPINYATRVVAGWGREHKQAMREQFGNVLSIGAIGESLPNPESFIDLDPLATDDLGIPKARINSYLDEMECKRLHFMRDKCHEVLAACGAGDTFEHYGSYDFFSSTHVFGGCRMGQDEQQSVVNAFGQSHGCRNLFIADASVFPSSGGGEAPSLTIQALGLRTGQYIAEQLQQKNL